MKGEVKENDRSKLIRDFEYMTRKQNTARRPDLTPEDKVEKQIWPVDMAGPQERNHQRAIKQIPTISLSDLQEKKGRIPCRDRAISYRMPWRRNENFTAVSL